MTVTVEELYQQAQQLSAEERRRLALLLVKMSQPAISQPSLGEQLREIRARIVASGEPLLDEERLSAEVAERRGER
jgi:hydroxyacyl-ACP dehydratase HTD2-like protein with hotdog domain